MLNDLVVVAAHEPESQIETCLGSLGQRYEILVVDTASREPLWVPPWIRLHRMPYETYQTGAMLWAYENVPAENYLFLQDSMRALQPDYVEPFRNMQPERGCTAWATFTDGFPGGVQPEDEAGRSNEDFGRYWYKPETYPPFGIFGSIFYANRSSLDELARKHLLPPVPRTKLHEQSNERLWSWAFREAGMTVNSVGGQWEKGRMERGEFPVFSKQWANRQ